MCLRLDRAAENTCWRHLKLAVHARVQVLVEQHLELAVLLPQRTRLAQQL